LSEPAIHYEEVSRTIMERSCTGTRLLGRVDAPVVVDSHLPLVQRRDGECRLALRLGYTVVLKVEDGAAREFEEPGCGGGESISHSAFGGRGKDSLHPTGVSANCITVSLMISSGRDEMSAERMNHCLPAGDNVLAPITIQRHPRTLSAEDLGDAVLLVKEALFMHLVEQAAFAVPRGERLEVFLSFFLRPDVAHLHHNERIFPFGPGREEHIRVKLAWSAFDTVTEVPDKRRRGGAVEAAGVNTG
jgi:hypothetical protein